MSSYDIVIKNARIVDGTGGPERAGEIGIRDGHIATIAPEISGEATSVLDAGGDVVAPGVIDPHTHYDAQVHWDPHITTSSWHGATTVGVGNCGFGFAPCRPEDRDRYMRMMQTTEQVPLEAMRTGLGWDWVTYPEWVEHMRRLPKGINLASYLPLNSLLMYVMGIEAAKSRPATGAERATMRDLLHQALDAGCVGFSFSYLQQFNSHVDCDGSPMPTDTMAIEEAYNLATVLAERGEGCIQALVELPLVVNNRHVAAELARISGRPVLHNIIAPFDRLPDYHTSILRWLDETAAEGLDVYSQSFVQREWNEASADDYNAWQAVPLFRTFSTAGDRAAKAALAADPAFRARARAEYDPSAMEGQGGALEAWILQRAMGATRFAPYEGQTVADIAAHLGAAPIDVFFDLAAESDALADFRTSPGVSWDIDKRFEILNHPRVLAGTSDGGAHVKFHAGGQYPTDIIISMVREDKVMSLEQAHWKLSGQPAEALGLSDRGTLEEGKAADLYVYDFDRLDYPRDKYEILRDLPGNDWRRVLRAEGIRWVMVNGEVIITEGQVGDRFPGQLLGTTRQRALV